MSNAAIAQQNTETEDPQLTSFVVRRVGLQHVNQGVGQERSCLEKRLAERKGDLGKHVGKCMYDDQQKNIQVEMWWDMNHYVSGSNLDRCPQKLSDFPTLTHRWRWGHDNAAEGNQSIVVSPHVFPATQWSSDHWGKSGGNIFAILDITILFLMVYFYINHVPINVTSQVKGE